MRKEVFFRITVMLVALLLGSQMVKAESYQHWVYWINEPAHVATSNEMAEITEALINDRIIAEDTFRLSTGITYLIPQPDLYLKYLVYCVQIGEPGIKTMKDVANAIRKGDVVKWGDDISSRVKNYYYSSKDDTIKFIDNYSGIENAVPVLLINGKPKIKMNCGNPLEPIPPKVVYDKQIILQPQVASTAPIINNVTVNVTINMDSLVRNYLPPPKPDLGLVNEEKDNKFHLAQKWWFWTILGAATQTAIGFVAHDENHSWYFWFPKNGNQKQTETGHPVDAQPQGE